MDTADKPPTAHSWLTARRFVVLLAVLCFISFPRVFLGLETFVFRDYGLFSYPVAYFQRQCFWRGELPLWNSFNHCGMPFLAQWNTMCLYPPALLYLLLPMPWSLSFFCLAHLFWGGVGMYFLAQRWTGSRLAAGIAGVIFAFNGLTTNFLMWPSHEATLSWLPWVLTLVPEAWTLGGRKFAWGALAAGFQMLAGGPETILFTWGLLALLAVGDWLKTKHLRGVIIPVRFFGIALLVAIICAAQLLPFLVLVMNSERHANYNEASYDWTMPIWGWANFIVPLFRTHHGVQGVFLQSSQNWTSSYYAGIGTIWLAAIGVCKTRDWRVRWLAVLAVLGMALALGDKGLLYRGVRFLVPALGFIRYPVKFVIMVLGLAPLLAAFGFAALARKSGDIPEPTKLCPTPAGSRRAGWLLHCREWVSALPKSFGHLPIGLALVILALIASLIVIAWNYPFPGELSEVTSKNGLVRAGLLLLMVGSALVGTQTRGRWQMLSGSLLMSLFWFDLVTHAPNQNPTAPLSVYSAGWARGQLNWDSPPGLGRGRVMLSPAAASVLTLNSLPNVDEDFRVKRLAFFCDCNLLDGIPQTHGFFSLFPGKVSGLTSLPYAHPDREFPELLDFMGVNEVTSPGKLFGWTSRPTAMPVVTAGQQPLFEDDQTAINTMLGSNIDFRETVLLSPEARTSVTAVRHPEAKVECRVFENHKVQAETHSPAPCLVVISQTWYPGWKAFVDGRPVKLWRANYAFQAVEVGAGRHRVDLVYQDSAFMAGAVMSVLGVLVSMGLLFQGRFKIRPATAG